MPRLVVLDGFTLNPGDNPWQPVAAHGTLVSFDRTPESEIAERARDADVVLTNKAPLSAATLAALPRLRGICVLATGVNVVDLAAASARKLPVCNVPAYSTASTAQHTIALLLELTNQVGRYQRAVQAGDWVRSEDFCFARGALTELDGLVLGVVGFGAIGRRVGEIARALGMQIQAVGGAARATDPEWLRRLPLEELFASSDVVTLHCPLTKETEGLVNAALLRSMRPTALLINAGRGALVNEAELASALAQGTIAGAALDVLGREPPAADNPLLGAKNCIITPHIAWMSLAARRRAMHITAENVASILRGAPQNVVNPGFRDR